MVDSTDVYSVKAEVYDRIGAISNRASWGDPSHRSQTISNHFIDGDLREFPSSFISVNVDWVVIWSTEYAYV